MGMITRTRISATTVLLAGSVIACDASVDSGSRLAPPQHQLVEALRIGSVTEPNQALTSIGGVLPVQGGTIWVGQPDDAEFRIFDSNGSLVATAGARGQGPGEFTFPGSIGYWGAAADSVWISDPVMRRVSIFTPSGTFVRSFPAPPISVSDVFTVTQPRMFTPQGSALALASHSPGAASAARWPIVTYNPTAEGSTREVASITRSNAVSINWRGQSIASGSHPLSDAPLVEFTNRGRILVLHRDAESAPYITLTALDATGDTVWSHRFYYEPELLPPGEADSIMEASVQRFQEFTRLEGRLSDAEARSAYEQSVALPRNRPAVRRMLAGVDESIWLSWSSAPDEAVTWWVLNSEGEPTGQVTVDHPLDPRAADQRGVWAVESDSLDVPYLVRYDLHSQ